MSDPVQRVFGGFVVMGSVVAGMVLGVVVYLAVKPAGEEANPYEYSLAAYEHVDSSLRLYEETGSVKLPIADPCGLAVDFRGNVYVAGSDAVLICDGDGKEIRQIPRAEGARCVAVDGAGRILVGTTNRVEVLNPNGGATWVSWESLGEQAWITSISCGTNEVFVADAGNRQVWVFDVNGVLKSVTRGKYGTGFLLPSANFDVAANPGGGVWVANPGYQRVELYSTTGQGLAEWGKSGMEPDAFCGCCNPSHLALGPDDRIYTAEKGMPRVKVYGRTGVFEGVVAAPDEFGVNSIRDLAVDAAGRVFVLVPEEKAFRIYARKQQK